jgi:hypothetical protein
MKKSTAKPAEVAPTAVFAKTLHRVRTRTEKPLPNSVAPKHPKGKSRDTREDRGERQMKTAHNPQTFPHGH